MAALTAAPPSAPDLHPLSVQEARRALGCDKLPGGQLENEGARSNTLHHWEFRHFFQVGVHVCAPCSFHAPCHWVARLPHLAPGADSAQQASSTTLASPAPCCPYPTPFPHTPHQATSSPMPTPHPQDLMTPFFLSNLRARMTSMTLALLEDTGWYSPRWEYVQNSEARLATGCDVALSTCTDFQARNPNAYYCAANGSMPSSAAAKPCFGPVAWAACSEANVFSDGCGLLRPGLRCTDVATASAGRCVFCDVGHAAAHSDSLSEADASRACYVGLYVSYAWGLLRLMQRLAAHLLFGRGVCRSVRACWATHPAMPAWRHQPTGPPDPFPRTGPPPTTGMGQRRGSIWAWAVSSGVRGAACRCSTRTAMASSPAMRAASW